MHRTFSASRVYTDAFPSGKAGLSAFRDAENASKIVHLHWQIFCSRKCAIKMWQCKRSMTTPSDVNLWRHNGNRWRTCTMTSYTALKYEQHCHTVDYCGRQGDHSNRNRNLNYPPGACGGFRDVRTMARSKIRKYDRTFWNSRVNSYIWKFPDVFKFI